MKKRGATQPVVPVDLDPNACLAMPKEYRYISLHFEGYEKATEPFSTFQLAKDGCIRNLEIVNIGLGCLEKTLEIFYKEGDSGKWWPGLIAAHGGKKVFVLTCFYFFMYFLPF